MANIQRTAPAIWNGNLQTGSGQITSDSEVLKQIPYSFKTRFEHSPGTNPEELIAAAHAACYSMAFAHTLSEKGYQPQSNELPRRKQRGISIKKELIAHPDAIADTLFLAP